MTPETKKLLAKIVDLMADYLETEVEAPAEEAAPEKETPKRGRPKKVTPASDDFDDETEEETEEEETEDDETEEETEEEETEDDDAELSAKELTTIKAALNAYSAQHGREKAVKVLRKFAPTVTRLKASNVKALLKALKV